MCSCFFDDLCRNRHSDECREVQAIASPSPGETLWASMPKKEKIPLEKHRLCKRLLLLFPLFYAILNEYGSVIYGILF